MRTRRRHQGGDLVDQFERRQHQFAGAVGARFGAAIDQMPGVPLLQVLQREGRARTVAQQPFESHPVGAVDAHRGIDGKSAAVLPLAHFLAIALVDQAAPDEGAQNPLAHEGLHVGKRRRVKFEGSMKGDARRIVRVGDGLEYPVDDAAMEFACREAVSQARRAHVFVQA